MAAKKDEPTGRDDILTGEEQHPSAQSGETPPVYTSGPPPWAPDYSGGS